MNSSRDDLKAWMDAKEDRHLEFKEAKASFHFERLVEYSVALANEGGGKLILGVTDKRPRRVVGSQAFRNLQRTQAGLIERLRLRIDAECINHPDGRVVVFHVPSRPIGMPVHYNGKYLMRSGESLVPMTPDQLKRILDESGPDFSAEVVPKARVADLNDAAIDDFRRRWSQKSKNPAIQHLSPEQLLRDAELLVDARVTYAALILLGTPAAISRYLSHAEVIFEYRSSEAAGPAQQREEYREGFFSFYEHLWEKINLRNDKQHFQDGLFILDVPTFNETAVREAILNAVSHRDYRHGGSIFIRQFPRRLEIVSPGGFPPGITPENILDRQLPRNRRIADVFGKCGLVERAGQGADRMFESCIREGKSLPDFTGTDPYQVALTLHGQVQDPAFLRFLEKVGRERLASFSTKDFLVLDLVHRDEPIPEALTPALRRLVQMGVVETVGRGRGTRYLLARGFYAAIRQKGGYTRRKGLDRETNKALLLRHVQSSSPEGCAMAELQQVVPTLSRAFVKRLMDELRREGKVRLEGRRRWSRWFAMGDTYGSDNRHRSHR